MKPTSLLLLPVDWRAEEAEMEFRALLHERSDLGERLRRAGQRLEFALLSQPIRTDLISQVRTELGYYAGRLTRQSNTGGIA